MPVITGTFYSDTDINGSTTNDTMDGLSGDDFIRALGGNDYVSGGSGNDKVWGYEGNDTLYGNWGYDDIYGDAGSDDIYGGPDRDILTGGGADDWFFFASWDTGDVYSNQADIIKDFTEDDRIFLYGSWSYAGETNSPGEGQYSIWQKDGAFIVTMNSPGDYGWADIVVNGANPAGNIDFYSHGPL